MNEIEPTTPPNDVAEVVEPIAQYYVAANNPEGASFPGVPLRDITEGEWASYPDWMQRSIDASDLYRRTKPRRPRPEAAPAPDTPTGEPVNV